MDLPQSITLEEHFMSRAARSSDASAKDPLNVFPPEFMEKLVDLQDQRLQNMNENGVSLQVISHTPIDFFDDDTITASNNELAAAVKENKTRLAGFASLPMHNPVAAATELERCVNDHGFVGALVDNHTKGNFYDGPEYDHFWSKAEQLDVPIYLHPNWPSDKMVDAMYSGGGLDANPKAAMAIGAFAFGWHASTATTVLRLIAAKVFDNHPRLKIVIGHSGELLTYMFNRVDRATGLFGVKRGFAEVMHSNIWITTSGMFDVHSLRCLLGSMPLERVLFSVDYPFSDNKLGKEYLEKIREEKILDETELEAFAAGNARKLLFPQRQ